MDRIDYQSREYPKAVGESDQMVEELKQLFGEFDQMVEVSDQMVKELKQLFGESDQMVESEKDRLQVKDQYLLDTQFWLGLNGDVS